MKVAQEFVDSTLGELWDVEVREHFSGRGMAGADCLGLVTSKSGFALAAEVASALSYTSWAEEEELLDYLLQHEPLVDSMGLDTIYYWPGLQVTED